jgi:hypothetical protein
MTKKIILLLVFFFLLISCGKKSDPEYKASNKNITFSNI